ncbi:hypothetical protein B484DRAFT_452851, partial [Ochromonadaceae sp. CCMP2298]
YSVIVCVVLVGGERRLQRQRGVKQTREGERRFKRQKDGETGGKDIQYTRRGS